ncbi:hypothetical protein ACU6ZM_20590, partial [Klebsiella aerogenes]
LARLQNLNQTKEGIAHTLHRRHLRIVFSTTFQYWLGKVIDLYDYFILRCALGFTPEQQI